METTILGFYRVRVEGLRFRVSGLGQGLSVCQIL